MRTLSEDVNSVNIEVMGRSYHHGALAEAMVDQALAEVRERGVEHVSLRSIAQALEVSPSAAYNHFADKDDLLRAVGACGLAALDERMARVLAAHPADSLEAAMARFAGLGRAYVNFAIEETHLFRLVFSPLCATGEVEPGDTGPYMKLTTALDELDRWGVLRPGIRPGIDLTIWAATHGMASLIVEGELPADGVDGFVESIARLVLRDVE